MKSCEETKYFCSKKAKNGFMTNCLLLLLFGAYTINMLKSNQRVQGFCSRILKWTEKSTCIMEIYVITVVFVSIFFSLDLIQKAVSI